MKLSKFIPVLFLTVLLLSACAGQPATSEGQTPAPTETSAVEPTSQQTQPAVLQAEKWLGARLNISQDAITVVSVEPAQWSDSCLGLGGPAETCARQVVSGYKVVLTADGQSYTIRTDQTGETIRAENLDLSATPATSQPGNVTDLVVQQLASQLKIDPAQVKVVSSESVEWSDACLGVVVPGEMCAQMITPGYKIRLEANGQSYEFHTNNSGSSIRQAGTPAVEGGHGIAILWKRGGETCQTASIGAQSVSYGPCNGPQTDGKLSDALRRQELAELVSTFQSFTAETKAGSVTFTGQGSAQATPDEQRSIAEWARLVYTELQAGRTSAAQGLIIGWHREGGIAGFCDDLAIYRTGFAYASSCKANQATDLGSARLTAEQLKQVFFWADTWENFEYDHTDPATADAMTIRLVFAGTGLGTANRSDQQAVATLSSNIYFSIAGGSPASASATPTP